MTETRASRFKKEDWLGLGARLLAQEGPQALTIERLTAAAQRTRGSFYHHFEDRDAFLRALMARWREDVIDLAGKRCEEAKSPAELRRLMRDAPLEIDHRFERAVRRFAASEPIVRAALDEVDGKRIEGLTCVIRYLRPELEDPEAAAFVQYAALVGLQWLIEDLDDPRLPPSARRASSYSGWRSRTETDGLSPPCAATSHIACIASGLVLARLTISLLSAET